ncbi:DUF805 domain-containing protein [Flexibacterium corallicola]|uniref:DUF805 domain-containing protein n=1 Tax=Flexibacterium corallicola TaxID=3037259 RepID=UPI00286F0C1E|nr:DUF805 domain-containing protein [Pseudovibrio sp. M1P-2-3]
MAHTPNRSIGLFWLFFSPFGRASRQAYWLGLALVLVISFITLNIAAGPILEAMAHSSFNEIAVDQFLSEIMKQNQLLPYLMFVENWVLLALVIKRIQDRGWSGFLALLTFLPFVNFAVYLFMGLQPSQSGANRYGPEPNSKPLQRSPRK